MRLIDENAIIKMLNTMDRYTSEELTLCDTDKTFPKNEVFIVDDVYEGLDELPTIEPERKKGKWILVTDSNGQHCICDHCGEWKYHQEQKFCGECGADMREEGRQE